MADSLAALEKGRSEVLLQISRLGDLRRGSIGEMRGRCSKPTCHCATAGDPGHGPHYRLTAKVGGKTVAETLATPAALRKAQREVAEFRKYQELSRKLLAINEALCRARPVEAEALSPQGKKRQMRSIMKSRQK
ncbi:MAG: DUF6788 family protein [Terriglobia bacterium]